MLGFSEAEQEHYARIETDTYEPELKWEYETPQGVRGYPALQMLAATQIAVRDIIGIEQFELSQYDQDQLLEAPYSRLVDASELEPLPMLDTEYAESPFYGNITAPLSNRPQQLSFEEFLRFIENNPGMESEDDFGAESCLAEMETCTSCLKTFIDAANEPNADISQETLNSRCEHAITFTAGQLIQSHEALFMSFPAERMDAITGSLENLTATIDEIYTAEEIDRINAVTAGLCGCKLTDFRSEVERGYNPVTGLLLNRPNVGDYNHIETIADASIAAMQVEEERG